MLHLLSSSVLLLLLSTSTDAYKLTHNYKGKSLLNAFSFSAGPSQNGGIANYVSLSDAKAKHLLKTSRHGKAVTLRTSTEQWQPKRDTVRIISNEHFNGGLFIFDVKHMPSGCGLWPSIWMVGPNWPNGGEIDIVEGVNDMTLNAMSSHTNQGCYQQFGGFTGNFMMNSNQKNNCNAYATSSQGCGVRSSHGQSYGSSFNKIGGGVYAMKWDGSGITTFFFPRHSVPQDIKDGRPNPGAWGTPENHVSSSGCSPNQHFSDMSIIINTDLCGTWPNGVWNQDTSYAGAPGTCAAKTGAQTCPDFIVNNGDKLGQAYWTINSIKIYN